MLSDGYKANSVVPCGPTAMTRWFIAKLCTKDPGATLRGVSEKWPCCFRGHVVISEGIGILQILSRVCPGVCVYIYIYVLGALIPYTRDC